MAIRRFPLDDVEIAGTTVPAGSAVVLAIGAANRDPCRFDRPDELDLGRADNGHISFGYGIHYCLGAMLARMEGEIAIAALLERVPALAFACPAENLAWRPEFRMRSLRVLPVTVSSGATG